VACTTNPILVTTFVSNQNAILCGTPHARVLYPSVHTHTNKNGDSKVLMALKLPALENLPHTAENGDRVDASVTSAAIGEI
jgi:hypothetical protein